MGRGCGRIEPYPCSGLCDADRFRASQLQHAVQDRGRDGHLGGLTLVRARAQPVADHPLEAADCGFGQCPAVIAGDLLPAHAAVLGNKLQVLIPLRGRRLISAVLLGTAPERGGTMTRASGWRSATERETPSWSSRRATPPRSAPCSIRSPVPLPR